MYRGSRGEMRPLQGAAKRLKTRRKKSPSLLSRLCLFAAKGSSARPFAFEIRLTPRPQNLISR
jgi:hypothetical protein